MTEEDKQLLIKDLCARIPYNVALNDGEYNFIAEDINIEFETVNGVHLITDCKPYLFPLSSMTEEQRKEYHDICLRDLMESKDAKVVVLHKDADWFEEHHFDYRGLIEKGLAIDATNLNIY